MSDAGLNAFIADFRLEPTGTITSLEVFEVVQSIAPRDFVRSRSALCTSEEEPALRILFETRRLLFPGRFLSKARLIDLRTFVRSVPDDNMRASPGP